MSKNIVITGSTRGIGFAMAREFLKRGCKVVINGTSQESVDAALFELATEFSAGSYFGFAGDISQLDKVEELAGFTNYKIQHIDIWINNAGVSQKKLNIWEIDNKDIQKVFHTNVTGVINGMKTAMKMMLKQGFGQIYNMEGFGSDGMMMRNMTLYGASKRTVRYLTRSMSMEASDTPVQIGTISPGIVLTDFILKSDGMNREELLKNKFIFNVLADTPETVAPFLVKKMLANKKNGTRISWLTKPKIFWRFLTIPFTGRDVVKKVMK